MHGAIIFPSPITVKPGLGKAWTWSKYKSSFKKMFKQFWINKAWHFFLAWRPAHIQPAHIQACYFSCRLKLDTTARGRPLNDLATYASGQPFKKSVTYASGWLFSSLVTNARNHWRRKAKEEEIKRLGTCTRSQDTVVSVANVCSQAIHSKNPGSGSGNFFSFRSLHHPSKAEDE